MNTLLWQRMPFVLLLLSMLLIAPVHASRDEEDDWDDETEEVTAEELQLQDIPVDERIFLKRWNRAPFDARHFTYTPEQIEQRWDDLTRALKIPYPSEEFLRRQFERYPWLADEIEGFDGDYATLHHRYLQVGQLFLAGDFQAARAEGMKLGAAGRGLAMLSQSVYAIYLADTQSEKHMLLQDVVNTAKKYLPKLEEMEKDPEVAPYAILVRLGYTYALARIAEEVPIPVAVARNYIPRIKHNADEILELMPEHALAHALRAGVDAGIMRRVGKFTGRMTYRARTTVVTASFDKAEQYVPDMALILYEKANAMVYVNKGRQLDGAIALLERAAYVRPRFAMEALDSMYAHRRLAELKLYMSEYPSFRRFDKDRRKFAKYTDLNLTSVLAPALTGAMLADPKSYRGS